MKLHKCLVPALLTAVLAACATAQGTSGVECGVGGALATVALCKAFGGSDKHCAELAILVGGAGGALCYSYAQNIQQRRAALAGKENDLDARIAYLHGLNHDTEELNRQLAERVKVITASTDDAVAALRKGQTSQAQLAEQRRQLDAQVSGAQTQVAAAQQELQSAQAFRARQPAPAPALDSEIARLEGLLADAQRKTTALAAQRQRI
ncbi:MAG: hypothetical protein KGI67_14540 [Pseudomonadota bacterium]|nr:hypothetical protein [Pseudomonadota bacterium]